LGSPLGLSLALNLFTTINNGDISMITKFRFTNAKPAAFIANLPSCLIGLEACGGAHYWVREFKAQGIRYE